jgi:polyhydroxyalkanoate synthesis regulator phasin
MELTQEHFDQVVGNLATNIQNLNERVDDLPNQSDLLGLATKTDIANLKEVLDRIDKRTDQDTTAVMKDVEKLDKRVSTLERLVKKPA